MIKLILPLSLTAALAVAAPAVAGNPLPDESRYRVPAGQVEHTVSTLETSGTRLPLALKSELFLSRNRGREVVTDLETGRVKAETVATRDEIRYYSADTNRVLVEKRRKGMPFNSATFNAAIQRMQLENGVTRVVGEKTVDGRRSLILQSVPGKWRTDRPQSTTVAVVDAETFLLRERTTADQSFTQSETFRTEYLRAGSSRVRLSMAKHPGAKVRRVSR